MSTAVAERETNTNLVIASEQTFFNEAQQAALRQMGLGDAPRGDIEAFFHQAKRAGLDPFARQIYMIERRSKVNGQWVKKYTIQASIDGFRVMRDRKGTFRGMEEHWCGKDGIWRDVWLDSAPPAAARITLHLEGFQVPITAVARYDEYVPLRDGRPTGQWGKMPALMTSKVAEALALRKAYPQDYSGLYTADEMAQADNGSAQLAPAPQPAPRPAQLPAQEQAAEPEVVEGEVVDEPAGPGFDVEEWAARLAGAGDVEALRAVWEDAQQKQVLSQPMDATGTALGAMIQRRKARLMERA